MPAGATFTGVTINAGANAGVGGDGSNDDIAVVRLAMASAAIASIETHTMESKHRVRSRTRVSLHMFMVEQLRNGECVYALCGEGGRRSYRVNTLDLHFELRHPNAVRIANYTLANMQDLSLIQ